MKTSKDYPPLATTTLSALAGLDHPLKFHEIVHLDDPACYAMIDFVAIPAPTIQPEGSLSDALVEMKVCDFAFLLVMDSAGQHVLGLLSSEDTLGEKPVKMIQHGRIRYAEIEVNMLMTPITEVPAVNYEDLKLEKVGSIIKTLQTLRVHDLLVYQTDDHGQTKIRGIFSASHISRQLGSNIEQSIDHANTIVDLNQDLHK